MTAIEVLLARAAQSQREEAFNRQFIWFLHKWKPSDEDGYCQDEFASDLATIVRECWRDAYTNATENYVAQLRVMAETMGTVKGLFPNG